MTRTTTALAYRLASFDPPRDMRSSAHLNCATCTNVGKLPIVAMGNNPEKIEKMFIRSGWDANIHKAHLNFCPTCVRRREIEAKARLPVQVGRVFQDDGEKIATVDLTRAPGLMDSLKAGVRSSPKEDKMTLKTLSPEHKAALRRELDANFDDTTGQYLPNVTDHTISEKLGIPRAVVIEFREAGYGELKEDPELSSLRLNIADAKKILGNMQSTLEKLTDRVAAYGRKIGM